MKVWQMMDIKIRNLDQTDIDILDWQAAELKMSREAYLRKIIRGQTLTGAQATVIHQQNAIIERLSYQLEKNNRLLEKIIGDVDD